MVFILFFLILFLAYSYTYLIQAHIILYYLVILCICLYILVLNTSIRDAKVKQNFILVNISFLLVLCTYFWALLWTSVFDIAYLIDTLSINFFVILLTIGFEWF